MWKYKQDDLRPILERASARETAARVAAAYCGRAYREVTTATIHLHGGTGFTWEHDAHLFHRRAWTAEHLLGTAGDHHAEIANRLGL